MATNSPRGTTPDDAGARPPRAAHNAAATRASANGAAWTRAFDLFSSSVTRWAGSPWGFTTALGSLLAWAAAGPIAHFSTSWQLVVNTVTTIVTFLMVFLIQRAQNRDSSAIQLKLDELILAV